MKKRNLSQVPLFCSVDIIYTVFIEALSEPMANKPNGNRDCDHCHCNYYKKWWWFKNHKAYMQ